MSETADTRNSQGADDGPDMDLLSAADIMQQAQEHASSELTVNRPLLLAGDGLVFLLAYGTVWLAVRGQRPYQGPPGWTLGVLTGLVLIAAIMLAAILNRAVSGVGGQSRRRRRIVLVSLAAGQVAVWAAEGGLYAAGASIGTVDLIAASGPILVAGLVIAAAVCAWRQWPGLGLGIWLIAAAAGSAFAAPATVWGIDALAGCAGFMFAAAILSRRDRP
jgi:general stress protein CsbA